MTGNVVFPVKELGNRHVRDLWHMLFDNLLESGQILGVVDDPGAEMRAQTLLDAESVLGVLQRQVGADGTARFGAEGAAAHGSLKESLKAMRVRRKRKRGKE